MRRGATIRLTTSAQPRTDDLNASVDASGASRAKKGHAMNSIPADRDDDHRLRPAWVAISAERQDYLDLFRDYIPRGQRHFKLRRELGYARLSMRSMESLQASAQAGDPRALRLLAGDITSPDFP